MCAMWQDNFFPLQQLPDCNCSTCLTRLQLQGGNVQIACYTHSQASRSFVMLRGWIFQNKLHVILISCLFCFIQNRERTNLHKKKTKFIQNQAALFCKRTALKRVQFFCNLIISVYGIQLQLNVLQKERQNKYVWYLFLTKLELKQNRNQ